MVTQATSPRMDQSAPIRNDEYCEAFRSSLGNAFCSLAGSIIRHQWRVSRAYGDHQKLLAEQLPGQGQFEIGAEQSKGVARTVGHRVRQKLRETDLDLEPASHQAFFQ